jgi:hypothetical protein
MNCRFLLVIEIIIIKIIFCQTQNIEYRWHVVIHSNEIPVCNSMIISELHLISCELFLIKKVHKIIFLNKMKIKCYLVLS